jgi:sugar phosphate isomerase/epimerase
MSPRLLSLAAGVCPETEPADFVSACAASGWPACGIWFDPSTWTDSVAAEVRLRLDDTGLVALDMEPVFITPKGDHGARIVEAAAAVGARNLLVVSRSVEADEFADRFGDLCDLAAPHGIGCSIEFISFLSMRTLTEALAALDATNRPNGGVLIDSLHLDRSGGTVDSVRAIAPERLAYAQLCDAPAIAPDDLYTEALDGRFLLGEGGALPVQALVDALPDHTALSMEIRSAALRSAFPDPVDRARRVLETSRRVLEPS